MRFVDGGELRGALPMAAAVDALELAFRGQDPSSPPLRTSVETAAGSLLLMPAAGPGGVGVKLVTLTGANPDRGLPLVQAAYVLFDPDTQEPIAVLEGAALTALRTAAVSGLATRFLAAPEARSVVLFGAGVQAEAHLEAMRAVRPIERVIVVSRSEAPAERLAKRARTLGLDASVASPADVGQASIVCTCTTSSEPLFDGDLLEPGTHVNAVGAYLPDARELDTRTMSRARVVVENREVAFSEAGDVIIPIREGAFGPEHVDADLAEVVRGAPVRTSTRDVTVFKSVGMAFEDLAVAAAVMRSLG